MRIEFPFLFHFAASHSGGGYKRLHEYARWFNGNGGTAFAIHLHCEGLRREFPANCYLTVSPSHVRRLRDEYSCLEEIRRIIGRPELYYTCRTPSPWAGTQYRCQCFIGSSSVCPAGGW
jgi:hypothetical protein